MMSYITLALGLFAADPPKEFEGVHLNFNVRSIAFTKQGDKLLIVGSNNSPINVFFRGSNFVETMTAHVADATLPKIGATKDVFEWKHATSLYWDPWLDLHGAPFVVVWRHDGDGRCEVIDPLTGKVVFPLPSPTGSRQRPAVAACTLDLSSVALYRGRTFKEDKFVPEAPGPVELGCWTKGAPEGRIFDRSEDYSFQALTFAEGGKVLVGFGLARERDHKPVMIARTWNVETGAKEADIPLPVTRPQRMPQERATAACADGASPQVFVTTQPQGRVFQVNLATKSVVDRSLPRYPGLDDIVWDSKGRRAIAVGGSRNRGGKNGYMMVVPSDPTATPQVLVAGDSPIFRVALAPDGRVAMATFQNKVMLMQLPKNK